MVNKVVLRTSTLIGKAYARGLTAVITELSPRDPSVAALGIKGAPFPSLISLNTSRDVVYQEKTKAFLQHPAIKTSDSIMQFTVILASVLSLAMFVSAERGCDPGSYDCGIERDRKVVKVCNLEGGWQVAARCEKCQDCEVRGGVGYCG
ncbi:hypothetical protein CISG_02971 [Coccidioides immitis RMSCC 3703]|uniref:Uncharacterized protein n=1 Tax=Coccidioides immitis RMSCC 3703 TaxID=454286 RepID=A0A0J8QM95_COCIT|nr:hypothetical protein CISG_02971 [Coccidioides immitis RMSCC 3703]